MDYQFGPGPLQVDQNTIDEKIKGDIGIVENGDVATHAIPSGYYVIWKGDLYVAKTDISSGTTLSSASNGNLTAKTQGIGADVAALNSNKANYSTSTLTLGIYDLDTNTGRTITTTAYIIGNIMIIPFEINDTLTISTMLQLRGAFKTVLGGVVYDYANDTPHISIQPGIISRIYFRPNITLNNASIHIGGFIIATKP